MFKTALFFGSVILAGVLPFTTASEASTSIAQQAGERSIDYPALALLVIAPLGAGKPETTTLGDSNARLQLAAARRGGGAVHRGAVGRGGAVYRGGTVYRGGAVYRRGVVAGAPGAACGYAPYPPCGGYYGAPYYGGGAVYRGGAAYRGGAVYRGGRVSHYGGGARAAHRGGAVRGGGRRR